MDHRRARTGSDIARRLQREMEREERRRRTLGVALAVLAVLGTAAVALGVFALLKPAPASPAPAATAGAPLASAAATPASTTALPAEAETTEPAPEERPESADPVPVTPPAPEPAPRPSPEPRPKAEPVPATQRFRIRIGDAGYDPSRLVAKADAPITLTVEKGEGCAAGFIIPKLDIYKDNSTGSVSVALGKLKAGTYDFFCGMEMVSGTLVVR